ncbi:actin-binding LIM protein 1 isoform X2 [Loxodonta africana]|uniref:actin-binding LIM protein 1 isoform X2 n=1 Tax=Loxodonta africana TaxID=9785 RepID=UPI0030CCD86F
MFTEGEEMYLQGSTVWHPDCKQSTKTEEKLRPTRTSSESIYSRPGSSIPGSPGHTIYAKVDNEILDYKDLAAIPKVKAIYDIERPDLITYEHFYTSGYDDKQERQSLGESPRTLSPTPSAEGYQDTRDRMIHRSTSQGSINSPVYSRHSYAPTTSRSPQHFHRPGNEPSSGRNSPLPYRPDSRPLTPTYAQAPKHFHVPDQGINIYRKPPIYKQHAALAAQSKSSEDIIKFSKFPAAQAPDPNEIPKIETDHWPGPPSLATIGTDTRRRSSGREEDDEELLRRRQLQEEQLMKLNSGLGQLILKEEMEREKESRERASLAASRYDSPINSASHAPSSKTSSLPGYGKNGLHRPVSTDFAQYNSYGDVSGGVRDPSRWPHAWNADGPRSVYAQHVGTKDISIRNAHGDQQRAQQNPKRRGQNQAGAPLSPRSVSGSLWNVYTGVRQVASLETQRHEEKSKTLLTSTGRQQLEKGVTVAGTHRMLY